MEWRDRGGLSTGHDIYIYLAGPINTKTQHVILPHVILPRVILPQESSHPSQFQDVKPGDNNKI